MHLTCSATRTLRTCVLKTGGTHHPFSSMFGHIVPAMARSMRKLSCRPSWIAAVDVFIQPMVEDFVFREALRLGQQEFLIGAQHAALTVASAYSEAVRGDTTLLDALCRDGGLRKPLHEALCDEARQRQAAGKIEVEKALLQLGMAMEELRGAPCVSDSRLVIGAQRELVPSSDLQSPFVAIGSSLIVCGETAERTECLWHPRRQSELLADNGCLVQVAVSFGDATTAGHTYLFEAAVNGECLLDAEGRTDDNLQVVVADVNGRMARNGRHAFWLASGTK